MNIMLWKLMLYGTLPPPKMHKNVTRMKIQATQITLDSQSFSHIKHSERAKWYTWGFPRYTYKCKLKSENNCYSKGNHRPTNIRALINLQIHF